MIYYPLSMLMLAGIREVLVISTPEDLPLFKKLLGDGSQWGMTFEYAEQAEPAGLAQAFIIGEAFLNGGSAALVLGDNIFYGTTLPERMRSAAKLTSGARIFAYEVSDPKRYGIVSFDQAGRATSLEEKPENPKSNYAIPGIYFYDHRVCAFARGLKPSARGELEITDLNRIYLENGSLSVEVMGRGIAWLDAGTYDSLLQAGLFVQAIESRQGMRISCPEEIAFRMRFIDRAKLLELAGKTVDLSFRSYLEKVAGNENS